MEILRNAIGNFSPPQVLIVSEDISAEPKVLDVELVQLDVSQILIGSELDRRKLIRMLAGMSPSEIDDFLSQIENFDGFPNIAGSDDSEWIDAEHVIGTSSNVERLLELLLMVFRLVAKVNTEQTRNAAKMGILSTRLAEQSGASSVNSAFSSLSGAGTALFASGAIVGFGLRSYSKGISSNIKSIKKNASDVEQIRSQPPQNEHVLNSSLAPTASQEQPALRPDGRNALQQRAHEGGEVINGLTTEQQIARWNADKMQMAGQAMTGMSYSIGVLGNAGFGVKSASERADATISDAQKDVASGLQRNEDQAAQQKAEIVAKILALVAATQDQNIQTVSTLSQAIKV